MDSARSFVGRLRAEPSVNLCRLPPPPQGVRVYRNKESAKLMRYVDEQRAAAQRAAAEQQRAALGRAPARHEPPPQRAAPRPKR